MKGIPRSSRRIETSSTSCGNSMAVVLVPVLSFAVFATICVYRAGLRLETDQVFNTKTNQKRVLTHRRDCRRKPLKLHSQPLHRHCPTRDHETVEMRPTLCRTVSARRFD